MVKWLVLLTSKHVVPGSNSTRDGSQLMTVWRFIAQSLSLTALLSSTVLQLGFQGRGVSDRTLFAWSYKNKGTMCRVVC